MALWTNAGLNFIAEAIQTSEVSCAITNVGISAGCGTISTAITAGVPITSITLDANVPANLSTSQSLTITDGTNSETVTTSGNVTGGTTPTIPINSWTPAHNYSAHTTGVCPTPVAGDIALYNQAYFISANTPGVAGISTGESLNSGYFDGTQATGIYLLVGYFATNGHVAVLMIEDIQYWNHTINNDSNTYQADSTI